MKSLRVLIVNKSLYGGSGTELYVRDLAMALLRAGHLPFIFSPFLGRLADELRDAGVPVFDSLTAIKDRPDVLHCHHTWETLAAVARFPNVPAIFVGHDMTASHDTPPRLPSIRHYIAVDYALHERFTQRHGLSESQVTVVPNAIDFTRFPPRGPLPKRPLRALQISNYAGQRERAEIKAACDARGIVLDSVGRLFGNASANPGELLPQYDLVFAKGRCAFEAAAVGAAVVLCDTWGCGPILSTQLANSGHGLLRGRHMMASAPLHRDVLLNRIDAYDPEDAARVSQAVRETFSPAHVIEQLTALYHDAEAGQAINCDETMQALATELSWWSIHWDRELSSHLEAAARLLPDEYGSMTTASVTESSVCFDRPFRGGGWQRPERDTRGSFCWLGPEPWAWLELILPDSKTVQLNLEIAHEIQAGLLEQLQVRINGQLIRMERTNTDNAIRLSGKLRRTDRRSTDEIAHILLSLPQTVRPSNINPLSSDHRRLGLAFRQIELEPAAATPLDVLDCPSLCTAERNQCSTAAGSLLTELSYPSG